MRLVDFKCQKCGAIEEVELTRATRARRLIGCDKCDGLMRRVISAPAVHFNGRGWTGAQREQRK